MSDLTPKREIYVPLTELEQLKMFIHQLEIRIVKLELTIKVGGFLLGVIPTALQIYQIFRR